MHKLLTWSRFGGYECSSKGDKRFSAFYAKIGDITIEYAYQVNIKGYSSIKEGKSKPPLNKNISRNDLYLLYKSLWELWTKDHLDDLRDLYKKAIEFNYILSDQFATSDINQARALSDIINSLILEKNSKCQ
jgi:hypothetical protein